MSRLWRRRWLAVGLVAVVGVGSTACSSSSKPPAVAASSQHTEPADPGSLFVPPPASLGVVLDDKGLTEVPPTGPVVEVDGNKEAIDSIRGWQMVWKGDTLTLVIQINEMPDADAAKRRLDATIAQGTGQVQFDVPGIDGAVGLYVDAQPGRLNTATVLFHEGIYYGVVNLLDEGEDAQARAVAMAQAQAERLRDVG